MDMMDFSDEFNLKNFGSVLKWIIKLFTLNVGEMIVKELKEFKIWAETDGMLSSYK